MRRLSPGPHQLFHYPTGFDAELGSIQKGLAQLEQPPAQPVPSFYDTTQQPLVRQTGHQLAGSRFREPQSPRHLANSPLGPLQREKIQHLHRFSNVSRHLTNPPRKTTPTSLPEY